MRLANLKIGFNLKLHDKFIPNHMDLHTYFKFSKLITMKSKIRREIIDDVVDILVLNLDKNEQSRVTI